MHHLWCMKIGEYAMLVREPPVPFVKLLNRM